MTQEFLALMLGVRRASVNQTAGVLQRAKLIDYRPGLITVLERDGLERAACEDYAYARDEYERLLGDRGATSPHAPGRNQLTVTAAIGGSPRPQRAEAT